VHNIINEKSFIFIELISIPLFGKMVWQMEQSMF
jgi:hypothetical protein